MSPISLAPVAGTKWVRSNNVQISNEYQQVPIITFGQEVMSSFDDSTTKSLGGIGSVSESLASPAEQFNLLNPTDGTVVGSATYQDVYVMLASLYSHVVSKQT